MVDKIGEQEFSGSRSGTYPFWTTIGRIDFVNVGKGGPISTGHVESFSPTGRKLATHKYGNLLRPSGAVHTSKDDAFMLLYQQGISHTSQERVIALDKVGEVISVSPGFRPPNDGSTDMISKWDGRTWQTDRYLPLVIRDREGKTIGEYQPEEGWIKGVRGKFASKSGKLAFNILDESYSHIVVLDASYQEIARLELPGLEEYPGIIWSPNDQYLACTWGTGKQAGFAVWDLSDPSKPLTVQEIPDEGEDRGNMELAWSPDSKQLAMLFHGNNNHYRIFRPETNETLNVPHKFLWYPYISKPVWLSPSQLRLQHDICEIPISATAESIETRSLFPPLHNDFDSLYTKCGHNEFVLTRQIDGQVVAEFWRDGVKEGVTPIPIPTIFVEKVLGGNKLVIPIGTNVAWPTGMLQLDLESRAIDHLSFLTDDGRMFRLNAEGKLLNHFSDWDHYLSYVVRYSSAVEVYLTDEEFQRRQSADPEQAAIDWILDSGGAIRLADSQDWFDPQNARKIKFSAADVTGIDLARCLIDDQSLDKLANFSNLITLDSSNSSLKSLDALPELTSLSEIDLSDLPIADVSKLCAISN
ncbi:MAG: hypothetical protein R3C03_17665 [Pirellulaceae bacterium]